MPPKAAHLERPEGARKKPRRAQGGKSKTAARQNALVILAAHGRKFL